MSEKKIDYPVSFEMKIHMKGKNGEAVTASGAEVLGRIPTHEEILACIASATSLGEATNYQVLGSPQELLEAKALEVYGVRVCVPSQEAFCFTPAEIEALVAAIPEAHDGDDEDEDDIEHDWDDAT